MNFITLHRVCGRNCVEPVTFNVATINTIMKAQDNYEHNTMIYSGNVKYLIQEKYETIIDILENRIEESHVFSTAVLSKKETRVFPNKESVNEALKYNMQKMFGVPVEEENDAENRLK